MERLGLLSILGLIFIVLKLTDVITWSWVWVLSPFWLGIIVSLIFFAFIIVLSSRD
jgi:hypothetical protein